MPSADGPNYAYKTIYCEKCGRKTKHTSTFPRVAIIFTICTLGLYAVVWPLIHILGRHWHCERCGHLRNLLKTARRPF